MLALQSSGLLVMAVCSVRYGLGAISPGLNKYPESVAG